MELIKLNAKYSIYQCFSDMVKGKAMKCQCGYKDKVNLSRKRFVDTQTGKGYTTLKCKECKVEVPLEFNFEYESVKALREKFM